MAFKMRENSEIAGILKIFNAVFILLFFCGCGSIYEPYENYKYALTKNICNDEIFTENLKKMRSGDDVIYTGLNSGLVARNCKKYAISNEIFDLTEESYKYDVDLENFAVKSGKFAVSTLLNETFVDYDGSLYERIMLNAYKGLNFMALNDYANARVEFNRALIRQDKAREYFAVQIAQNQKELQNTINSSSQTIDTSNAARMIERRFDSVFAAFETAKNFTNPYASYLASVFFFMDKDYKRAADLFREVAIINQNSGEITRQNEIFQAKSAALYDDEKRYIFVVYEDGFGVEKGEFSMNLPLIIDRRIISINIALQTLNKKESSFSSVIANGVKTTQIVDLDDIVATEFRVNFGSMLARALIQTITKATLNFVAANNDRTGFLSLFSAIYGAATTKADTRFWQGLPKTINVAMLENNGILTIKTPQNFEILNTKLDESKNALIFVRSFATNLPTNIDIIQN